MIERLTNRCDERWMELTPRGEGRYCARCDTTVIDLSRLTKRAAEERSREGGCFRMRLDERGAPVFKPDPERRLGGKALAMAAALAGCSAPAAPATEHAEVTSEPLMMPAPEVPAGVALEELAAVEVVVPAPDEAGQPNAEQRELTRRKHAQPIAQRPIDPGYEIMGGMVSDF